MLLPSGKLTRFEDWVQSTDLALSPIERQLLGRSREVLETAQRRRSRARTLTLATVSVAAVVAIVLALVANTTANRARLLAAESLVGSGQYLLTTGLVEEGAIALVESFDLDGSAAPLSAMGQVINGRGIWATALGDLGGTAAVRPAVDWTSGLVAVAGSTDRFVLLDLESGEQVAVVEVVSPLSALDFLGDGRLIAGHEDGTLTVYSGPEWTNDGPSESLGAKIWDVVTIGESDGIATTAAQGDSRTSRVQRFTITEDSSIKLSTIYPIDSLLGEDIAPRGFSGGIEIVRLMTTHDGDRLVTLGSPTLVAAWDLITGERHAAHAGTGSGAVWSGAASPDGSVIVTGHQNRTLVIRDSDTLEPLGLPTPPVSGQQRSLAFSPSGDRLISSGQGGVLAWQFNPAGEARPPSLGTTPDVISSTSALFTQRSELSPDGTHVVAAVSDRVRMFKVDLGLETHPAAAREEIRDVVSAGNAVWLAGRNGNLIHWDRTTGHSLAMPSEEGLQALAASPAGDSVYTGSRFGSLGVAGPSGWQTQPAHDNQIWAIEWSPDRSVIATASADNTIGLWDPTTLAPVLPRFGPSGEAHQAGLKALAFVDSDRIVTVGGDGYLRVWDAGTGKEMSTNLIVDNQVNAVVPIGEDVVATGDETGTITLFDISAAVTLGELNGHTSAIRGLALSPDGSTLASSGQDNTVRLWDLETNAEVGLLRQSGAVRALAYNAEGDEIIGVDINGGVVVWNANWQDWPRQMCSWLAGWDVQRSWAEVMGTEPYDPACGS